MLAGVLGGARLAVGGSGAGAELGVGGVGRLTSGGWRHWCFLSVIRYEPDAGIWRRGFWKLKKKRRIRVGEVCDLGPEITAWGWFPLRLGNPGQDERDSGMVPNSVPG